MCWVKKIVWEVKTLKSLSKRFPLTSKEIQMGYENEQHEYFLEASKQHMLASQPKVISWKIRVQRTFKKEQLEREDYVLTLKNYLSFLLGTVI